MLQVRIKDGSFFQSQSATLAGDNAGQAPRYFTWRRDDAPARVTFFTDICLQEAIVDTSPVKVAWLIEPPEVNPRSYQFCIDNGELFDCILTHSQEHLAISDKWLLYPFGGSWIAKEQWGIKTKHGLCSIIASDKDLTDGHKLRHEVIKRYGDKLAVMGSGYNPIDSKVTGLGPYYYSIIIENARRDFWFTEKLIDCLSQGTVPIYWGCPHIGDVFDADGIISFETIDELGPILAGLCREDYNQRLTAIQHNYWQAWDYRCAEDWLSKHYPFLFEV